MAVILNRILDMQVMDQLLKGLIIQINIQPEWVVHLWVVFLINKQANQWNMAIMKESDMMVLGLHLHMVSNSSNSFSSNLVFIRKLANISDFFGIQDG